MRIRGTKPPPASPSSSSSDLSVSASSSSSSITATHSSLASSQDSSNSSAFSSTIHRCHGLDLLVKAIHQVSDGSVIGFPYIQRRVTTRRRPRIRAIQFDALFFSEKKLNTKTNKTKKKKKNKRKVIGLRSQIGGPVLQPWGRRSGEIGLSL